MHDLVLGQFFPGDSIIHRLDPRAKLILLLIFIVMTFAANSVSAFIILLAAAVVSAALTRIPPSVFIRGMKPLLFLLIFTTVINVFMTGGEVPLFEFGIIHIYKEGIINAVTVTVRIVLLVLGSGIFLTYTTSPISLTDGLETLLSPLSKIHLPVHEFSMMMTIALRFIPTLVEETDKIMNAQKARGADFSSGGLIKRAKALLPVIIPLFVSAFKRAEELATAMECRCYRGGEGRGRLHVLRYRARDAVFLTVGASLLAAVIAINILYPIYRL